MTNKQDLYVCEYMKDLCISAARERSGYKGKITDEMKIEIDSKMLERKKECRIEEEEIIRELKRIALASKKQESTSNKLKALELLGKHIGMFEHQLSIKNEITYKNPYADLTEEELLKLVELQEENLKDLAENE